VIPEQTLSGSNRGLLDLNTTPFGRYLFKDNRLTRDYIQIGRQGELWASPFIITFIRQSITIN